jgi:hypothetical protein
MPHDDVWRRYACLWDGASDGQAKPGGEEENQDNQDGFGKIMGSCLRFQERVAVVPLVLRRLSYRLDRSERGQRYGHKRGLWKTLRDL